MAVARNKTVSIIVPVYNEESVLPAFLERLTNVINGLADKYDFKVILINDGSRDKSWKIIQQASLSDERFSGICLSRNFGHQAAHVRLSSSPEMLRYPLILICRTPLNSFPN